MSAQQQIDWISEAEYRDGEEISPIKHEWFAGEVFAMAGGTFNHTRICGNVHTSAKAALRGRRCSAHNGEQRVKVEATGLHTYPDSVIFCPPARFEGTGDSTLLTPKVIFEVLSQSTESYDRTRKFDAYKRIETLTDYVLVAQNEIRVEHFRRAEGGWLLRVYTACEEILNLENVEIELPLSEIYEELEFPELPEAPPISP
ncbi:Endonuclease, Uma2 family (restriction endonuclease fold) [Abditibacterium utsteinense]|uniref:Endonuclease, Uma2 family (Restriction endonuclease fold) n=1 Tax=Abditibacterium utsteinense TaxID=1960156 RepID=A0A2S8SWI2_9BACT|nr:Uma2 family endonuclease [Abditibacterium utsteinense]PQV65134.1 Endonuclease, Uma2 family (restriction endonuclease fold) [Abditibacterium utsteinense]